MAEMKPDKVRWQSQSLEPNNVIFWLYSKRNSLKVPFQSPKSVRWNEESKTVRVYPYLIYFIIFLCCMDVKLWYQWFFLIKDTWHPFLLTFTYNTAAKLIKKWQNDQQIVSFTHAFASKSWTVFNFRRSSVRRIRTRIFTQGPVLPTVSTEKRVYSRHSTQARPFFDADACVCVNK